jgi:Domain of unknown function (DUF4352)
MTPSRSLQFALLPRAPVWLILLLLLAAIGVGVYAYFTTPLPLGLSAIIRTPGGEASFTPTPVPTSVAAIARTAAGQPLILGASSVTVQAVQHSQDLTANNRGGPAGSFTVLEIVLHNAGSQPLAPQLADFRLVDDVGRVYAADMEGTRAVNTSLRRRVISETTVPPSGTLDTLLAFETPPDASGLALRVSLGYGELELPAR